MINVAGTHESFVLLPVAVAVATALAIAYAYDEKELMDNGREKSFFEEHESCCDVKQGSEVSMERAGGGADGCYLFEEWTSSTGLLFAFLMLYILLVAVANLIVCYKFISTWNLITLSLREQNRACRKLGTTSRRRTCHEALTVRRYQEKYFDSACTCPVCLIDIQDQELVASCDKGCHAVFHRDCLFEWLEYKNDCDVKRESHTSCPCCRQELLWVAASTPLVVTTTSGWLTGVWTDPCNVYKALLGAVTTTQS